VDTIIQSIGREETKDISFTLSSKYVETALETLEKAKDTLDYDHIDVDNDVGKVSIVGAGIMTTPGVAAKMFEALYDANINIKRINTSEIRVSVIIDASEVDRAVKAVHAKFFGEE
jgi:aspartate kinase